MKKLAIIAGVLLFLAAAGAGGAWLWWNASLDEYARTPFGAAGEKVVEIPPGARLKEVAALLKSAGVISDENRFLWVAKRMKKDRSVKAGEFAFNDAMLPEAVLDHIASGKVKLYHCTIPEGLRVTEIAPILEGCHLASAADVLRLSKDAAFLRQNGVKGTSLEGYLLPDTYSFPKNPKPEQVVAKMIARFQEEYRKADAHRKAGVTLNMHETATLASIVEKETGAPEERPHISCVFHNRLKKHMKLETDPTVIYAKILRLGSWDGNISRADLLEPHPYNTYTVKGLPPGPIANAGVAAMQAALNPIECDDLFFVACGGGRHVFCPDYECHERNVAKCQLHK